MRSSPQINANMSDTSISASQAIPTHAIKKDSVTMKFPSFGSLSALVTKMQKSPSFLFIQAFASMNYLPLLKSTFISTNIGYTSNSQKPLPASVMFPLPIKFFPSFKNGSIAIVPIYSADQTESTSPIAHLSNTNGNHS